MLDPFIGSIVLFAGSYAPRGWAFCDGQLLAINTNQALYSILGNTYGGDGRTTFALPDLRGRAPVHKGVGPGLSPRELGRPYGAESVTLTAQNLPAHTHATLHTLPAEGVEPPAQPMPTSPVAYTPAMGATPTPIQSLPAGNNAPFGIAPPSLVLNFIIALEGVYPSRS